MNYLVDELKLNVVGECSHQFKNDDNRYGVTMVYLLSESHLSIIPSSMKGKLRWIYSHVI